MTAFPKIVRHICSGLALLLSFVAPAVHAQLVPNDDLYGPTVRDLTAQTAGYLNNAEIVHKRLVELRSQLDACNGCAQQNALQAEYDRYAQREKDRKTAEGIVLRSLGFPYKDFADVGKAIADQKYKSPDPALAKRYSDAKYNAITNYCYITNNGNLEKTLACRAVFDVTKAENETHNAPQTCRSRVYGETNVNFDEVPPPDTAAAEFAAYKDAWRKYDLCRKKSDLYQFIQIESVRLCRVDNIASTTDLEHFACACKGISAPRTAANCPAPTEEATKIPEFINEHPVGRVLLTDPGPDLLGIRLLMPISEAEKLVAAHMHIARTAAIGNPLHGQGMIPQQLEYQTSGLGGKWLMSEDGNEYVFLFEAPQDIPGRVLEVSRVRFVSTAALNAAQNEIHQTRGHFAQVNGLIDEYYGKSDPKLCTGRSPQNNGFWVDEQTGWLVGQNSIDPRDRKDYHLGSLNTIRMPKLISLTPAAGVSNCGPLLDVVYGGDPGDSLRTGRSMWVIESLYDLGLTQWATRSAYTGSRDVALRPLPTSAGPTTPTAPSKQAQIASAAEPTVTQAPPQGPASGRLATPPTTTAVAQLDSNARACSTAANDDSAQLACLHLYRAQEDARLNDTYRLTLARLDTTGQDRLRLDERAWIKQRDSACAPNGGHAPASLQGQQAWIRCLGDETKKRTAELAAYQ